MDQDRAGAEAVEPGAHPDTTLDGPVEATPIACPACQRAVVEPEARFCAGCGFRFTSPSVELFAEHGREADPLVGRTLADRYRIVEVIGRGGMGVVYRVEHTRIGKAMAMKLLHGDLARDRDVVRRFRREAEAVSKLDHPNTVQVFDFGHSEGMTFLVMELLGGRDLGLILHQEGTIGFPRAAHLLAQVCASVQQAHDKGIVHRDLKPENIRVLDDRTMVEVAKVLDFGLAKLRESNELANASVTRQGYLLGTPYYMAPEHIRGEHVDPRSDVYALGAVLYKAVVGVPPFWASTPVGVLTKHLTDDVVPPSTRSPRRDLPREADEIVLRALAKSPTDRYPSVDALRDDLERFLRESGSELRGTMSGSSRSLHVLSAAAPRVLPTSGASDGVGATQPIPMVNARTRAPIVAATRDEVERFERRLRMQQYVTWTALVVLVGGVAGGATYAWARQRPSETAPVPVEVEPNDGPANATTLPSSTRFGAHLGRRIDVDHGDVDVFALEVPQGTEAVRLSVSAIPNIDLVADVFAPGRSDPLLELDSLPMGGAERAPNLPLHGGRYLVRVHERREAGHHPTENVSDEYGVEWEPIGIATGEEREWNDTLSQAEELHFEAGAQRRGFVGWTGDVDSYCSDAVASAWSVDLDAVPGLDLVLTLVDQGSEHVIDRAGRGEAEHAVVVASTSPRRVCVRVSAAAGAQRGDAVAPYTLTVSTAPAAVEAPAAAHSPSARRGRR